MRGVAALAVVFWHWQIFSYVGGQLPPTFLVRTQPLYMIFAPLYQAGYLAVDLFFALSGFIFFALYSDRVASREVSAKQFFVLRLSRLYPLHLATLVFVTVAQAIFARQNGTYFGSHYNDPYHFLLNLLFASSWGFEKGHSFNGPFWSVSVEALLYAIFFVFSRFCRINLPAMVAMIALGLVIWPVYPPVGHGIYMFYLPPDRAGTLSKMSTSAYCRIVANSADSGRGADDWELAPICADSVSVHADHRVSGHNLSARTR
jgi:peptidoglycan/LPS O-acetylase OafA/YrhL